MTESADPHWELLPHDPEGFFGLEDDYDLRELKRRYNSLLRQFKPEKHPDEFKRIRSAYESLRDALRYGMLHQPDTAHERTDFDWGTVRFPREATAANSPPQFDDGVLNTDAIDSAQSDDVPPRTVPAAMRRQKISEQLRRETAEVLYTQLEQRAEKTPFDFYVLAILSDVARAQEPLRFSLWLLAGLEQYPNEPGLFGLLREYFCSDVPLEIIPELLKQTARSVPTDRFYFLSEPLWDRLLKQAPFVEFRVSWDDCESNLLDSRIEHRLTFYLHILVPALWKADADWWNELYEFVEANYEELPWQGDRGLDFVDQLKQYHEVREELMEIGSLIQHIDRAIIDYCVCDPVAADVAFLECQEVLATHCDELLEEFPVLFSSERRERLRPLAAIWERIADDVRDRFGAEIEEFSQSRGDKPIEKLACRLTLQCEQTLLYTWWYAGGAIIAGLMVNGVYLIGMLIYRAVTTFSWESSFGEQIWRPLSVFGVLLLECVFVIYLMVYWFYLVRRLYRRFWRPELAVHFRRTHQSWRRVADELEGLNGKKVEDIEINDTDDYAELIRDDIGLQFYAISQQFRI